MLYVKDGQIYRAPVGAPAAPTKVDKGEAPFINAWGRNSGPKWSPDGTRIAFSSNRTDHSFIGIYDERTKLVSYVAPSVDRDTSPTWSPDGKQIAFLRRPGLPFGQQATPGSGSGLPDVTGGRGGGGRSGGAGRTSRRTWRGNGTRCGRRGAHWTSDRRGDHAAHANAATNDHSTGHATHASRRYGRPGARRPWRRWR